MIDDYVFKVPYEVVEDMVLQALKEGFDTNEHFPDEDGYKKLRKSYLTLIKHHSPHDEWERWKANHC